MPSSPALVELIDDDGRRERQLVVRQLQHLLAHDLGHEEALGLVRQIVRRIQRLALGQVLQEQPFEHVDVGAVDSRQRARTPTNGCACR